MTRTIITTCEKAALIQSSCSEYHCTLLEIGVGIEARVVVEGEEEDLDKLLEFVELPKEN